MQQSKLEADMLSVVIPTLNAERTLAATLSALMPAAVSGVVRQVVIVDGGSDDSTLAIAEEMGADVVASATGAGPTTRNRGAGGALSLAVVLARRYSSW